MKPVGLFQEWFSRGFFLRFVTAKDEVLNMELKNEDFWTTLDFSAALKVEMVDIVGPSSPEVG